MKLTYHLKPFLIILLSVFILQGFCQVPDGGTMLNTITGTTWQKVGKGALTQVNISDQPFTKALRMTTGTDIQNFWDSQIQFPSAAGIATNDVILVAFYARTIASVQETGQGYATVIIENSTSYEKELSNKISIDSEWKEYYASVKSKSTWTTSQVRYALFTGYLSQTIEVANVRFLNYKNSLTLDQLPVTEISYSGQASDASWRAPANDRINQIRKGIADIVVYDEYGNPVPEAEVSVEMVRHKFGFGSAIPASVFLNNATFRNKVYELFNEVVFENDLKWPMFNSNSMANVKRALDSLDRHQIPARGHNVIWPSWRNLPSYLKNYETNPVALRLEIDKHIDQVTQFTKGRINDWDVINEAYSEKDLMGILGDEVMADWFKRVRNNDRTVKLYLNDYGILSGGGTDTKKQDFYYNLVQRIESWGGTVEGIGMQGHFGSELTSITKVYSILDRFAALDKEIKITEHDINISQRKVQAEYTRDFMTICFSHEAVKSFLFWGFWANAHWLPEGAMFNSDWTIRPNGELYKDLVFNQWWTKKIDSLTNTLGKTSVDGFLGTYKYTIKSGDKTRTGTFRINNSKKSGKSNPVILTFDNSIPDNIEIVATKPACLCEGESLTLKATAAEGLSYQWFLGDSLLTETGAALTTSAGGIYTVKVKKGNVEISSPPFEIKVNPVPVAKITASGDTEFCPGGKVALKAETDKNASFNWMKGALKIQGSVPVFEASQTGSYTIVATANGCSVKSEVTDVKVFTAADPACTTGIEENKSGWQVYPNPFSGSFTLETGISSNKPVTAELFNAAGVLVSENVIEPSSGKTKIGVTVPGFYTLRVKSATDIRIFKLVAK